MTNYIALLRGINLSGQKLIKMAELKRTFEAMGLGQVQAGIDRLAATTSDVDECRIAGQEVYLLLRRGAAKTVFTNNLLEKKLKVSATTRNWQTITTLAHMGKAMAE